MPYVLSNPPEIIKKLPESAKKIWIKAFNASYKEYGETKAFQIAWSTIEKSGFKKDETGNWRRW